MMERIVFEFPHPDPPLQNAVLIAGLPGVGNIGKQVVEEVIRTYNLPVFSTLYSHYFPPQCFVSNSRIELPSHKIYLLRREQRKKGDMKGDIKGDVKETELPEDGKTGMLLNLFRNTDIVLLTGNCQSVSSEGQYDIAHRIVSTLAKHGLIAVISIGGYGTGTPDRRRLLITSTDEEKYTILKELLAHMTDTDVGQPEDEEGGKDMAGGKAGEKKSDEIEQSLTEIIGSAGLLPAVAPFYGIPGMCLMCTTLGVIADPLGAATALKFLSHLLDMDVPVGNLVERGKELEKLEVELLKRAGQQDEFKKEDVNYIF